MPTEVWIETDEAEDVAGSIRHALRCSKLVNEDPQVWKWFMLSLHSALQGACICHLTTTAAPLGAVTEKNNEEWTKYFEEIQLNSNKKPPQTYLMNFPDLLKAIRKPNSVGDHSKGPGIAITEQECFRLKKMHNEFRNGFTHYEPCSWHMEISGSTQVARLAARIIRDILDMGWGFRHMEDAKRNAMRRNLDELMFMSF